MIRALTILAAIAAFAVSAAPASAGLFSSPLGLTTKPKPAIYDHGITQGRTSPPRGTAGFVYEELDQTWVTAPPKPLGLGTRSGGEVVSDFAKAPAAMRLTAIKDGTSNTLLLGKGVVDVIERDDGYRVSPPKSSAIHENEGIDGGFKTKMNSRLRAAPKPPSASVTPSGGEILGSDWLKARPSVAVDPQDGATRHVANETAKANVRGKAKVPRRGASLSGGIPDGTSNTMMRSDSRKPPNGIIAILIG